MIYLLAWYHSFHDDPEVPMTQWASEKLSPAGIITVGEVAGIKGSKYFEYTNCFSVTISSWMSRSNDIDRLPQILKHLSLIVEFKIEIEWWHIVPRMLLNVYKTQNTSLWMTQWKFIQKYSFSIAYSKWENLNERDLPCLNTLLPIRKDRKHMTHCKDLLKIGQRTY